MSQLTSRGLDNTSYAFVSDIYIEIMIGDIFGNELYTTTFKIESQSKRHMNRQHKVRVIGYI